MSPDETSGREAGEIRERYRSKTVPQALAHLVEEMGEASAAAGKTLRWGPASYNPEVPLEERELNLDWLLREIDDVERAIGAFREHVRKSFYPEWRRALPEPPVKP